MHLHELQPVIREIRQYQVELDFNDVRYVERDMFDGSDMEYLEYLENLAQMSGVYQDMWC